jgi:hypothetical protein
VIIEIEMKRTILYTVFLLLPVILRSQDISVQAEYPSVVQAGQQFNVTWTINEKGGEFSEPSFEGFYKLMGPQESTSSNISVINGKMSQQTSSSYTYFLQAVNAGKFEIPAASYKYKGKIYNSEPVKIEVVSANSQGQQNAAAGGKQTQSNANVGSGGGNIFLDMSVSRKDVYIGEGIAAGLKIYTRENLGGINEIKYPDFSNFLKADIETPQPTSLRQEYVNGTQYGTALIQQFLLYPQVTGEITIDPVQVTVLVQQKSGQSDPFFGDFFTSYENVPRVVVSKPVKINVKPLPGEKPADFSGIVGKLSLRASLTHDSVKVNDAVNFRIAISGNGNLKLAGAPLLKLSPDVEVYDPKITDDIKNTINGTSGQKTFDYLLIPRHYGDFTIPPVTYSFFNTSTGKYEKLATQEFHFHARKGTEQSSTGIAVYGGVSKEDVKYLGQDIRFIKNNPGNLSKSANILLSKRSYYSFFIIAFAIFITFLFVRREHIRRNSDLTAVKNRKAGKIAVQRLRNASACLKRNEIDKFHEEILKAIWGYLSDKLSIPVSDLTRNNAVDALKAKGIDDEKINVLTDILDKCEYARYAPASDESQANVIYNGASMFISGVENSIG